MSYDLRVARIIDATPEAVFDAFVTPEGQTAFYSPDDPGWVVESEGDLRVCGSWTVLFGPSQHQLYRHRHVFRVIDRPRRIVLVSTETRPDGSTFTTEMEFTFQEHDGKTLMTLAHRGFPTAELRDEHRLGVPNAIAQLRRVIRAG